MEDRIKKQEEMMQKIGEEKVKALEDHNKELAKKIDDKDNEILE